MAIPQANEMGNLIGQLGSFLYRESNLIDEGSYYTIKGIANILKAQKRTRDWQYEIATASPILFEKVPYKNDSFMVPQIYTIIRTNRAIPHNFEKFNSVLEIKEITGTPISRWHVDLANTNQEGPLYHLQFGGHWPNQPDRTNDFPLSIPRWNIMPMDIVLMSELVVANFFPEHWVELCKSPGWNVMIRESQKLCFTPLYEELINNFNTSGKSFLETMWANRRGNA
jgi:hypothetical protein